MAIPSTDAAPYTHKRRLVNTRAFAIVSAIIGWFVDEHALEKCDRHWGLSVIMVGTYMQKERGVENRRDVYAKHGEVRRPDHCFVYIYICMYEGKDQRKSVFDTKLLVEIRAAAATFSHSSAAPYSTPIK